MHWFVAFALVVQASTGLAAPYYGKSLGDFQQLDHSVAGTVRIADSKTIIIENFVYDGTAPDAFFWIGTTNAPDDSGTIVPVLPGVESKLEAYTGAMLTLTLPGSMTAQDYKWLSVWCRAFKANFGFVTFPAGFTNPASSSLGALPTFAHQVRAENVQVEDAVTLTFTNLYYDGNGPDAYFWADTNARPTSGGTKLIWKPGMTNAGRNQRLTSGFNGETIRVTMPEGLTIYDFRSIGLWCVAARQDFGSIQLNLATLNVPAVLGSPPTYTNCEVLKENMFQAHWRINAEESTMTVELAGCVSPGNYMAFGRSGSDSRTRMEGSDVVVAWMDDQTMTHMVVDYNLESKAQCSVNDGKGACPDDTTAVNGTNDVTLGSLLFGNGVTRISYSRPLDTGDRIDKVIPTDREVYVSWAIGPINPDGRVAKHVLATTGDHQINFGRSPTTCPALPCGDGGGSNLPPWAPSTVEGETSFRLDIGQSGGERGYTGITGRTGWGIAWYVNGVLIPEITVWRGTNYTFEIFGGDDAENSAQYHPFYITNDAEGGYAQKSTLQKQTVTIYAGPAEGPYCNWKESESGVNSDDYDSFTAYKTKLQRQCVRPDTAGGKFHWMPDDNTPDVVYYQCYTHRFLGWKINVNSAPAAQVSLSLLFAMIGLRFLF